LQKARSSTPAAFWSRRQEQLNATGKQQLDLILQADSTSVGGLASHVLACLSQGIGALSAAYQSSSLPCNSCSAADSCNLTPQFFAVCVQIVKLRTKQQQQQAAAVPAN
jgi:hypothetical protein